MRHRSSCRRRAKSTVDYAYAYDYYEPSFEKYITHMKNGNRKNCRSKLYSYQIRPGKRGRGMSRPKMPPATELPSPAD